MAEWSEAQIETLTAMWREGASCSEIARAIGSGFTRNAVIGKVHRLKLDRARPARAATGRKPHRNRGAPKAEAIAARVATRKEDVARARTVQPALAPAMAAEPFELRAELVIPPEQRLSLLQLTERTCKWPIGDPLEPGFHFCGGAALEGKPYCAPHWQRAHAAPPAPVRQVPTPAGFGGMRRQQINPKPEAFA